MLARPPAVAALALALVLPGVGAVKCLSGLGGPPTMFGTVRFDQDSGAYTPCSGGEGCEAFYTKSATEVDCPEVSIHFDGYNGRATGYCETYTLNVTKQDVAMWLGTDGAGQLTYSQCQAEPMNQKPGHQLTCERDRSFSIAGGLSWRGQPADSNSSWNVSARAVLVPEEFQQEFDASDSSSGMFIVAKECCYPEDDETACNAAFADSVPEVEEELEGGLAGLVVIILLCVSMCFLGRKCAARKRGGGEKGAYEQVAQLDGKTTSAEKLRSTPGKFKPVVDKCPGKLPEGTTLIINSLAVKPDTKGLPWLSVSVSTPGGVVQGYLPESAVEQVEQPTSSGGCGACQLCCFAVGFGKKKAASAGSSDDGSATQQQQTVATGLDDSTETEALSPSAVL